MSERIEVAVGETRRSLRRPGLARKAVEASGGLGQGAQPRGLALGLPGGKREHALPVAESRA